MYPSSLDESGIGKDESKDVINYVLRNIITNQRLKYIPNRKERDAAK